jgi:hypothetical protein
MLNGVSLAGENFGVNRDNLTDFVEFFAIFQCPRRFSQGSRGRFAITARLAAAVHARSDHAVDRHLPTVQPARFARREGRQQNRAGGLSTGRL